MCKSQEDDSVVDMVVSFLFIFNDVLSVSP